MLIVVSILASCLLLASGLEFLGLLFILVYVGAVLIVMVFNIISINFKGLFFNSKPRSDQFFLSFSLLINLIALELFVPSKILSLTQNINTDSTYSNFYSIILDKSLISFAGLYGDQSGYLLIISLILLFVMFGLIVVIFDVNPYMSQKDFKSRGLYSIKFI